GSSPQGSLVIDSVGTIYGAANFGGAAGYGVVYSLTPNAKGKWTEKLLHTFPGGKGGGHPTFGLTSDSAGNLYGIATNTDRNLDLVYQLSMDLQNKWNHTTIFRFSYPSSGEPDSAGGNVLIDPNGNAFGFGGGGKARQGTLYQLSQSAGKWIDTLLYSFTGISGGILPEGPPITDQNGNLYGVTVEGGKDCPGEGCGTVFEFAP
ncbi:MAG TPA: choice-of-anchor tandem repeat GloVer-containing protein, partial [Candidatus Acidoferrum sp.]|nr:choice-of-anchor tandem repeat GloVer-containing protein [Candidatus Acidoferrum sp.]